MGLWNAIRRHKEFPEFTENQCQFFDRMLVLGVATNETVDGSVAERIEFLARRVVDTWGEDNSWFYDDKQKKIYIEGVGLPLAEFESLEALAEGVFATSLFFRCKQMSLNNHDAQFYLDRVMALVGGRWTRERNSVRLGLFIERGSPADLDDNARMKVMDPDVKDDVKARLGKSP